MKPSLVRNSYTMVGPKFILKCQNTCFRPASAHPPALRELAQCVSRLRACDFFLSFFLIRNSEVNLLPKITNSGIKYIEGT